jgi:flagellar motility protein MotE (MotC chaperone)
MNNSKLIVFAALIALFSIFSIAQEAQKVEAKYSEEDFKKKLDAELDKALKRIGQEKLADLSRELLSRESTLKDRELEIEKMKQELLLSQEEFQRQLKDFQSKQQSILGCLEKQSDLREKRINHMVDVVSNMKPEVAAEVLSVQETALSVEILGKLDAGKVSKIFNLMDKEISARLQKQYMNMKR